MPAARVAGLFFLLLTAGCAGIGCAPLREPPQTGATPQGEAVAVKPETHPATPSTTGSTGQSVAKTETPAAKTDAPTAKTEAPAAKTEAPAAKTEAPAAKTEAPNAKPPAKVAASPSPKEPIPKKEGAAPAPAKPAAPPSLDLTSLEKRLRETDAIGVMTKLTLKNQVDDLLNRFKAHYQGRTKTTLAQLRQPYDTLILKVLSLLQDKDPSLASAIAASREAIWAILSDPAKFSKL